MKPEEIIAIRNALGITQERFASILGASFSTVNRWENGKSIPSRLYIREIKELGANHGSYLCRREEFKEP